jgi:hypothetical protein
MLELPVLNQNSDDTRVATYFLQDVAQGWRWKYSSHGKS